MYGFCNENIKEFNYFKNHTATCVMDHYFDFNLTKAGELWIAITYKGEKDTAKKGIIIHNSLSPHSKSTSWAMQWSRNRQDDISECASAIRCSICSSQPGTPLSYLRSIQMKQSEDVLLSLLAAAVIPHTPAASRNQLFLLRSTGPALTQGYKNSSREPGGIVLLCQPREDKRKTPEPFRENERKIKRASRLLRAASQTPSADPSHFLSVLLCVSFGSTMAFPISREWRAGLRGAVGGQTARNLSGWSRQLSRRG